MLEHEAAHHDVEAGRRKRQGLVQVVDDEAHAAGAWLAPRLLEHAGREVDRGDRRTLGGQPQRVPPGAAPEVEHRPAPHVADRRAHHRLLERGQGVQVVVVHLRPSVVALPDRPGRRNLACLAHLSPPRVPDDSRSGRAGGTGGGRRFTRRPASDWISSRKGGAHAPGSSSSILPSPRPGLNRDHDRRHTCRRGPQGAHGNRRRAALRVQEGPARHRRGGASARLAAPHAKRGGPCRRPTRCRSRRTRRPWPPAALSGTAAVSPRPQSAHVTYAGPALESSRRYFWRVRAGTARAARPAWSAPAWFETGLLEPGDWKARWIEPSLNEDVKKPQPAPMLRGTFAVRGKLRAARAYVTSHGLYELEINGRRVGDELLHARAGRATTSASSTRPTT